MNTDNFIVNGRNIREFTSNGKRSMIISIILDNKYICMYKVK